MSDFALSSPQRTERKEDKSDHPDEIDRAFSPALYWRVVGVLAFALALYTATGTALLGTSWLTAYWDALAYWCSGGYCR